MNTFFELEAGNLTIAAFFFLIALIVSTRSFVSPAVKKGLFVFVFIFFGLLIAGHYYLTSERMDAVKRAFLKGDEVVCENRMHRKASQGIVISQKVSWKLEGDLFVNVDYNRPFHAARCIVKTQPNIDLHK
jgi:hypothetical protein